MKYLDRVAVAKHLFELMNHPHGRRSTAKWDWYVEHGWHEGYLRIADEIVSKGYKP